MVQKNDSEKKQKDAEIKRLDELLEKNKIDYKPKDDTKKTN